MKITRACDYTIRALIYMAQFPLETTFMRADISKACNVPNSFLGKILQSLAKSDILVSERGKKGGFKLGRDPRQIYMYDVFVAIDGPVAINNCFNVEVGCYVQELCSARKMWEDVQSAMIDKLKKYTLADIATSCPY